MIISVEEARKRLGKDGKTMTDTEVVELVQHLDELARFLLDMYMKEKANKPNKPVT